MVQLGQAALHAGQQLATGFGERDVGPMPLKLRLIQTLLEGSDLRTDRGRADIESRGPLGKAQAARHGLEGTQSIEWD